MALPNVPISAIPGVGDSAFPALDSITVTDLVGPQAANRQPVSLDTRSLTLRDTVNKVVETINALQPGGAEVYLRRDGTLAMLGALDMGAKRITNVADPTGDSHAVNRLYADGRYVRVVGDAMTGALRMANATPVQGNDGSTDQDLVKVDATPDAVFGNENLRSIIESNGKAYRRSSGLYQIWDSGNQGPGSGLNADLVDGHEGAVIARTNATGIQTFTAKLRTPSTVGADAGMTLATKDYVDAATLTANSYQVRNHSYPNSPRTTAVGSGGTLTGSWVTVARLDRGAQFFSADGLWYSDGYYMWRLDFQGVGNTQRFDGWPVGVWLHRNVSGTVDGVTIGWRGVTAINCTPGAGYHTKDVLFSAGFVSLVTETAGFQTPRILADSRQNGNAVQVRMRMAYGITSTSPNQTILAGAVVAQ